MPRARQADRRALHCSFRRCVVYGIAPAFVTAVFATGAPADETPLTGAHDSPFGHFVHSSAFRKASSDLFDFRYAVCNMDQRMPLIFTWREPNMVVGDAGALPGGSCAVLDRQADGVERDLDASISFTQAGRVTPAAAYLTKLTVFGHSLPAVLSQRLRSYIGPEKEAAQPSVVDVKLVLTRSAGSVRYDVSWEPATVTILLGEDLFSGGDTNTAVAGAKRAGEGERVIPSDLRSQLAETSLRYIPSNRLERRVVVVTRDEETSNVSFSVEGATTKMSAGSVTLIDRRTHKLIADVRMTSFDR